MVCRFFFCQRIHRIVTNKTITKEQYLTKYFEQNFSVIVIKRIKFEDPIICRSKTSVVDVHNNEIVEII